MEGGEGGRVNGHSKQKVRQSFLAANQERYPRNVLEES